MVLNKIVLERLIYVVGIIFIWCGSREERVEVLPSTTSSYEREESKDDMKVEGLMGMLHDWEVQPVIEKNFSKFISCYSKVLEEFPFISGKLTLYFRIREDGKVRWVYVSDSTVGSQKLHSCIIEEALKFRFPKPHGGEAEFSFPLELEPPQKEMSLPLLEPSYIENQLSGSLEQIKGCIGDKVGFKVGIYVDTTGRVVEAGVSVPDIESGDKVDCILSIVKGWRIEPPPPSPSKILFAL